MGEGLFLGSFSGEDGAVDYDHDQLTTHGVIVGMTGSGKTGLAVVLLEELLRKRVPVLILDPKGDMGNLLLNFPSLDGGSFAPWVEVEDESKRSSVAEETAQKWKSGLEGSGLGPSDLKALRDGTQFNVFTPGADVAPINLLGSLKAPPAGGDSGVVAEEIESFVSGLLRLVDISGDPLSSREHILLVNLIQHAWSKGKDIELPELIQQVQKPPIRKLGVFDVDTFFPAADRTKLALRLNGVLANPAYAPWMMGPALDIERMLWTQDKKPCATVVSLAHLNESERQMVAATILSKVASWMQTQPGSSKLRCLVYMDEVYGFVPPNAMPPSKKPILTLLKQARAFGVGVVLATQNPVDLDYKAMSNAGTWMIGRLQTENDKARIIEGLQASGPIGDIEKAVGTLGKREFVLHTAKSDKPRLFSTRWAMSFLRGPLTKDQLRTLATECGSNKKVEPPSAAPTKSASSAGDAATGPEETEVREDETTVVPKSAAGTPVYHVDPRAEWLETVGADSSSNRLEAALAFRVRMLFDETKADLNHAEEWEAILRPIGSTLSFEELKNVDYDARDFDDPPEGARYVVTEAPINKATFFKSASTGVKAYLHREKKLNLFKNKELKVFSRVGESKDEFVSRCEEVAEKKADEAVAKLRDKYEAKVKRVEKTLATAERQLDKAEASLSAQKRDEVVGGVSSVLGMFLGGKSGSRGIARKASGLSSRRGRTSRASQRVASAKDKIEDREAELEDLEIELAEEVTELTENWTEKAEAIEEFEVGLEKTDIDVVETALVWIPV